MNKITIIALVFFWVCGLVAGVNLASYAHAFTGIEQPEPCGELYSWSEQGEDGQHSKNLMKPCPTGGVDADVLEQEPPVEPITPVEPPVITPPTSSNSPASNSSGGNSSSGGGFRLTPTQMCAQNLWPEVNCPISRQLGTKSRQILPYSMQQEPSPTPADLAHREYLRQLLIKLLRLLLLKVDLGAKG